MQVLRPATWFGVVIALAISGGSSFALGAEQLAGIVASVDVEAKKIAVAPTDKTTNVDVTINDQTEIATDSGKVLQLKDLKVGDGLGIAHTSGVASKIVVAVKPSELTGHVKSVKADAKTFVVTETGTTTDITVKITTDTSIVTVKGRKLDLKELKKGDGVGISHLNSVATKILVNAKPAFD